MRLIFGTYSLFIKFIYFWECLLAKKDTQCPFCSSSDFKVAFKKYFVETVCLCHNCYLYWTNPIFKLADFYSFIYSAAIERGQENGAGVRIYCRSMCNYLSRNSNGNRLLEFGSSNGYFLFHARESGFEVTGVEISKKMAALSRGSLNLIIVNRLEDLLASNQKFNVIYTRHTLEHVGSDIKNIFVKFGNLLVRGGVLFIIVPIFGFSSIGAVHPLGFTREFFIKSLPKNKYDLKFMNSGFEPFNAERDTADELLVLAKKIN